MTRRVSAALLLLFCGIGAGRIIATYRVFNQTWDEPTHISGGFEWLQGQPYTDAMHPPLGRLLGAVLPFLAGVRLTPTGHSHSDGNQIFHFEGAYFRNLSLARLGILPFFLLANLVVWLWARQLFDERSAVASVFLFSTLPVVLGHSGLVTTDMPVTGTLMLALFLYCRWLDALDGRGTFAFGAAAGLALVSKFSAVMFLPACAIALWCLRWVVGRTSARPPALVPSRSMVKRLVQATVVAVLVIWATYRFSVGTLAEDWDFLYQRLQWRLGDSQLLRWIGGIRMIPAFEMGKGVALVFVKNWFGHAPYFLGIAGPNRGSALFFPVLLVLKTPLPFLILVVLGAVLLTQRVFRERDWRTYAPMVTAITMLAVVVPAGINLGVRHVLPLYPVLAIVAGQALVRFFMAGRRRLLIGTAGLVLVVGHITSSVAAHPDYFAYFNVLARGEPERIVVDNDLDWGQDLVRLAATLRERRIDEVWLAYWGSAEVKRHGLPRIRELQPHQRATGWIAVSLFRLKASPGYQWLEAYNPVGTVGASIRLYHVPPR